MDIKSKTGKENKFDTEMEKLINTRFDTEMTNKDIVKDVNEEIVKMINEEIFNDIYELLSKEFLWKGLDKQYFEIKKGDVKYGHKIRLKSNDYK